ncbi:phage Tail Collar domain protein [Burkholderia thailandensis 34]|uniref:phage tail protein n=1 Tax=Burkholderia thailandensis TaxID=57975 RepID=UPI0005D9A844|nr:phage tail protein [Burkholderia thailandensis]AJY31645.1 phage Tail Collar domain protein [Burkholderia thailandensis 34]AOJ59217.1 phage tail protein [Burkholderia thailandensis]KXF58336.1 phage tail protein [Burkholderia thailandensis]PNE76904.1 phage tail protein [Burkholderia thailandensis]
MSKLVETSRWEEDIYQIETSDPVEGGPDGISNLQARQLVNRTRYLKDDIERRDKGRVLKAGDTMEGALLGKTGPATPNNERNAGFGFANDPDTGLFSPSDGVLQLASQGLPAVVLSNDGGVRAGAAGPVVLVTGNAERVRVTKEGRALVGTADDNGRDALQVRGNASASNGVIAGGLDRGDGGQLRACGNQYGAFIRNDDVAVYLMSTKKGDPLGSWSDWRPLSWSLESGKVIVDGNGSGTVLGGTADVTGNLTVGRSTSEGQMRLGPVDGYFYSNQHSTGWWSKSLGSTYQYIFADHTFRVDGKAVWHEGSLTPLDLNRGGTLKGQLTLDPGARIVLAEGSAAFPSLTFANDGAPDTGLFHIADGHFAVSSNGAQTVHFAPDGTYFDKPAFGGHPNAGDRSNRVATTQWIAGELASAMVGQIVFEMRTAARAGYLKCNGALVKRADYPALWAYAQGSGALVAEKDWMSGNFGCFSDGDGSATFRIPELRGEFLRCWDDGRGSDADRKIGTWQDSMNRTHGHAAGADGVGDHGHNAWTDNQGWHGHHGWTGTNGNHNHNNDIFSRLLRPPYNGSLTGSDTAGSGSEQAVGGGDSADIRWAGDHNHEFNTEGAGTHAHNVGVAASGAHSHAIHVAADGGNEARPRNLAVLAMIRAY